MQLQEEININSFHNFYILASAILNAQLICTCLLIRVTYTFLVTTTSCKQNLIIKPFLGYFRSLLSLFSLLIKSNGPIRNSSRPIFKCILKQRNSLFFFIVCEAQYFIPLNSLHLPPSTFIFSMVNILIFHGYYFWS